MSIMVEINAANRLVGVNGQGHHGAYLNFSSFADWSRRMWSGMFPKTGTLRMSGNVIWDDRGPEKEIEDMSSDHRCWRRQSSGADKLHPDQSSAGTEFIRRQAGEALSNTELMCRHKWWLFFAWWLSVSNEEGRGGGSPVSWGVVCPRRKPHCQWSPQLMSHLPGA